MLVLTGIVSDALVLEAGVNSFSDVLGTIPTVDGDGVAAWKTTGLFPIQASAGNRPIFHASGGPGNKPYISSNGTQFMVDSAIVTDKGAFSIIAVSRLRGGNANNSTLFGLGANALNFYGPQVSWIWSTFPVVSFTPRIALRDYWSLHGAFTDGVTFNSYSDAEVGIGSGTFAGNSIGLQVLSTNGGANVWTGDIAALIYIGRATTIADINALYTQLGAYYFVPDAAGSSTIIVTAGNSFGANYAACGPDFAWQNILPTLLTHPNVKNYSLGTSFATTADLAARQAYIQDFPARVGALAHKKILLIGELSNDPSLPAATNFIALLSSIKASGKYDKIIAYGPLARQNTATTAACQAANDQAKNTPNPPFDAYIDFMANVHFGPDGAYNDASIYFNDLIHDIAAGHMLRAQIAQPKVDAVIDSIVTSNIAISANCSSFQPIVSPFF